MHISLGMNMGELLIAHESYKLTSKGTMRQLWCFSLMFDAIWDKDIDLIEQIVYRLDGPPPESRHKEKYANIVGDAINDVLDQCSIDDLHLYPEDTVVIGLAKAILAISMQKSMANVAIRKAKVKAVEMILTRTGGRKVEGTKIKMIEQFIQPDWMKGLGDGQEPEREGEDR